MNRAEAKTKAGVDSRSRFNALDPIAYVTGQDRFVMMSTYTQAHGRNDDQNR